MKRPFTEKRKMSAKFKQTLLIVGFYTAIMVCVVLFAYKPVDGTGEEYTVKFPIDYTTTDVSCTCTCGCCGDETTTTITTTEETTTTTTTSETTTTEEETTTTTTSMTTMTTTKITTTTKKTTTTAEVVEKKETPTASPTGLTYVGSFKGTYYSGKSVPCKGGSGRTLINCNTSGEIKGSVACRAVYNKYGYKKNGRTKVWIECSGMPSMTGWYYVDDCCGSNSVVDFYYYKNSNCPFRKNGVISVKVYI